MGQYYIEGRETEAELEMVVAPKTAGCGKTLAQLTVAVGQNSAGSRAD